MLLAVLPKLPYLVAFPCSPCPVGGTLDLISATLAAELLGLLSFSHDILLFLSEHCHDSSFVLLPTGIPISYQSTLR